MDGPFRCSPQQRRFWKLGGAQGWPYVSSCVVRLSGSLEEERFARAVRGEVVRYEILRTCLREVPGLVEPVQVISGVGAPELEGPFGGEPEARSAARSAGVSAEVPVRLWWVRISPEESALVMVSSVLCSDSEGLVHLARSIGSAYAALAGSGEAPPEPVQYADVSEVFRELLEGEETRQGAKFWERLDLSGASGQSLPFEGGSGEPGEVLRVEVAVVPGVVQSVAGLAREWGVEPAAVWLGAWQALLSRLTAPSVPVVGVRLDGRSYEEFRDAVGPFARVVPVRLSAGSQEPFGSWVGSAQASLVEGAQWQDFYTGGEPLAFGFAYQGALADEVFAGVRFSVASRYEVLELHRVSLWVVEGGERLALHYLAESLSESEAEELLERYVGLLESALSLGSQAVSELPLLTGSERVELGAWESRGYFGRERTLHGLVSAQAVLDPHRPAVRWEGEVWGCGELVARAQGVARCLRGLGVRRGDVVGVCLERSAELIAALLGVLETGAAYLPLDPDYPAERLRLMFEDARASALLTRGGLGGLVPAAGRPVLDLAAPVEASEERIDPADPEDLAYVIYTSGSTGRPKGVQIPHRAITNRLLWMQEVCPLGPGDRVLHKTPFSFDASVWEIFVPLLAGAEVVVARPGGHQDPAYLVDVLRRERVTVVQLVPSLLRLLLGEPGFAELESLRRVFCGGEALSGDLRERFFRACPGMELHNLYGPTEVSIDATWERCRPGSGRGVTIGSAIFNTRVCVLDGVGQPLPRGLAGELWIGGEGLAWGYRGRPDLTAERFVPDALGGGSGARLYRTGDLGRWRESALEYLGRGDRQLKVRGVRVEPGEIEAALDGHEGVRESVVVVREDRLAAYVAGEEETAGDLRAWLSERVPPAMVPSVLIWLDRLPRTPSGKVDREALPSPEAALQSRERAYVIPEGHVERLLAEVWQEVLGLERVGVTESFFEVGGDSIRSIRVLAESRKRGLDFSVQDLFRHRTIRDLAAVLEPPAGEALAEEEVAPFSLISEADRRRLPAEVEDAYPLTYLQAGMMYHSELEPEVPIYHDQVWFHLRLRLEERAVRRALEMVVARHAVLRSSFHVSGFSEPLQLVHRGVEPFLEVEDWSQRSPEERRQGLRAWREEEKRRRFAWDRPPLLRVYVHRLGREELYLTVSKHHILMDGWSFATLMVELLGTYQEILLGREPEAKDAGVDFRHFVALERRSLASDVSRRYWEEKLAGASRLPLPRRDGEEPAGVALHEVDLALPDEVFAGLMGVSQQMAVPLKSVLLAVHLRVLSLLCGQTDVLTGLVSTGRPEREGGERIVGLFLNALPFRQKLPGGRWLDLVQETFVEENEMLPHRRHPLVDVQKGLSGEPLLETDFNYLHYHVLEEVEKLGGVEVLGRDYFEHTNFALSATFGLVRRGTGLNLSLAGSPRAFTAAQVSRFGDLYLRALTRAALEPQSRYEEDSLLSAAERRQVLERWNATQRSYGGWERSLHGLVAAQAERSPERPAVWFEGEVWSYGELEQRANRLAGSLRRLGVGRGCRVAVLLERSAEMVAALLGVLKAGAAYVPLDPEAPLERLVFLAEDASAALVLTRGRGLPGFQGPVLDLESDAEAFTAERSEGEAGPDDLAYVIYTSGSTGSPKGVLIPHRAVTNRLLWMQETWPLRPDSRVLHKTPLSFDASVWEIFVPLLAGAQVVVARPGGHADLGSLVETVAGAGITVLQLVPSLLRLILEEPGFAGCTSLERVFCGGEALPGELRERFFFALPATALHNLYGPTEASIDVSAEECTPGRRLGGATIGRPIFNTRLYVVDRHFQPVRVGTSGELCAGGDGLAWGYQGRTDLTAERFVPDPFGGEPGGRLYHTGDLALYEPDGTLEHRGRVDHQVKLRGVRIELGEIESVLAGAPGVREAAAAVREERAGDPRLIAYAVPAEGVSLDVGELRSHLERSLPRHMLPSALVVLERLHRLPNGKLDRLSLPAPEGSRSGAGYVAPRTPAEELVAEIWAQILRLDRVGAHDDFFALGGHSLLATQIVSRLRHAFGVDLPLRDLFENPSVAKTTARIEALRWEGNGSRSRLPLRSRPRDCSPLPLSFAQERLWFLDQLLTYRSFYNIPLAIELRGRLNIGALALAFRALFLRHESLRTTFGEVRGVPVQLIDHRTLPSLLCVDLARLGEKERRPEALRWVGAESLRPFDLAHGPLLRASIFHLTEAEHLLSLVVHHIASDGWSSSILIRDLVALYRASLGGEPPALPDLPVQYADFAVWQREGLRGPALESQLAYWKKQLAGAPPLLELPADRPRPNEQRFVGATRSAWVGNDLASTLRSQSREHGATLYMLLLAGFNLLLGRYAQSEDLVVGTPVAGRVAVETEELIGFFANTLVLRTDLSGRPSFLEALARGRAVALGAFDHQDLPFERLVEELQPERDLSHTPLFQVMFALDSTRAEEKLELPGLRWNLIGMAAGTAKFDLTLSVVEEGEGGLDLSLEYSSDLFDASTADRILLHYRNLLQVIAEDPVRCPQEIPLSAAERHQVRLEWNDTGRPEPAAATFLDLLAVQVREWPERTAVVWKEERLTYVELDRRANRLAHRLRRLGVRPEVRVAICMERCPQAIVAVLGVMKAGGAYVPVEAGHARERLGYMVRNSGASILLTLASEAERLPSFAGTLLCLDADESLELEPALDPSCGALPENLAYVIYTSGSTGRPKGALVPHRNLLGSYLGWDESYALRVGIVCHLQMASFSFDVFTGDLVRALGSGGTLVICPRDWLLEADRLYGLIRTEGVDAAEFVPAVARSLMDHLQRNDLSLGFMRLAVVGSDVWNVGEYLRLRRLLSPSTRLVNSYGVTEATIDSSWFEGDRLGLAGDRSVPIGHPFPGSRLHVLDRDFHVVPAGVAGELCIAGRGVARGYLDRPDLTAERFTPDPLATEDGARLYRSGDLARFRADGVVELLGRVDDQFKIRGFRVELGEIEAVLEQHSAVRQAVVVPRSGRACGKRLVAYFVTPSEELAPLEELREFLRQRLPDYMIPDGFVPLERFPLTPHGKLDRQALPEPSSSSLRPARTYVAPRTDVEEIVAEIWASVLGIERVSVEDSFFDVGGHSLLAMQLVSRIRESFQTELSVRSVFLTPTVSGLAALVEARSSGRAKKIAQALKVVRRMSARELSEALAIRRAASEGAGSHV